MSGSTVEIREVHAFLVLAEELSFARAAERLDMSQTALTRLIQKLERKVGVTLFHRTTRRVDLTRAGAGFRIKAADLADRLDEACRTARQLAEGTLGELRIGYTDFAICGPLARIVREFRGRFPDISPTLVRGASDRQLSDLADGGLDVGFVLAPVQGEGLGSCVAWYDPAVVVAPEGHALARLERVPLAQLKGIGLVSGVPERWGTYLRWLDRLFDGAGTSPAVAATGPDVQVILGLVEAGFGVAVLPASVSNVMRAGLVTRPLDAPGAGRRAWLETRVCWHAENRGPLLENFLAAVEETLDRVGAVREPAVEAEPAPDTRRALAAAGAQHR
jgi:DNA-binding transcriptional LysR family regulator